MNTKNIAISSLLSVFAFSSVGAQDASTSLNSEILQWTFDNILVILAAVVIIAAFFSLMKVTLNLLELEKIRQLKELGIVQEPKVRVKKPSLWKQITDWAWKIVPVSEEKKIDLGHDYDGIRELNNRLPPWWLALFYGTIAFAFIYGYVYHWSGDWSSQKEYEMAMDKAEEAQKAYLASRGDVIDENTVTQLSDVTDLDIGASIYQTNCLVCHGPQGQGGVGPNFCDEYWLHGGDIKDLFRTIKYGVPDKGMISWSSQLRPKAMQQVASYILTMQGTNPPNQKEPQGEIWTPGTEEGEAKTTEGEVDPADAPDESSLED